MKPGFVTATSSASRAIHRGIHRPGHESSIHVHREARLVHRGRPHGDEEPSTASTP
jgi:hypothetical protein